jgi:tetratricopeptide (TPR) repeat protein
MEKTCFVIMGYGIKNNLNLDLTYEKIIKPCLEENHLQPYPLYENHHNGYRCDEISGTACIDYKFVTCLKGADIVVADISTMNANAIYELGARHALRPRATILLCAEEHGSKFNFFDITYVPIIRYKHNGTILEEDIINETKQKLNEMLDCAINDTPLSPPDNPIYRALNEQNLYSQKPIIENSIYKLYLEGREKLDNNQYRDAVIILDKLYEQDPSEENLLLLVLAKYKMAEENKEPSELYKCINLIREKIDINLSASEELYGRLGAIYLRLYDLLKGKEDYDSALNFYRRGADFCTKNLYCSRNYCALLLRICELTTDENIILEHYYTAKYFARLYLKMSVDTQKFREYGERVYYIYNQADLNAIIEGNYNDYESKIKYLETDTGITVRQKETIQKGMRKLKESLETINEFMVTRKFA